MNKFHHETVIPLVDEIIRHNAKKNEDSYELSVHTLKESVLHTFSCYLIKEDSFDKTESWSWLTDSANSGELAYMVGDCLLHEGCSRTEMIKNMRKAAISYYMLRMQQYIDMRIEEVFHQDKEESI